MTTDSPPEISDDAIRARFGEWDLPAFPALVIDALERVRDPDSTLESLTEILLKDNALGAKVMRTANSAAFALRHRVKTLEHAVTMLGRDELESILIAIAVRGSLPRGDADGFQARRFWLVSTQRATLAKALAERIHRSTRSESFTAALLQDMALPMLAHRLGETYAPLLNRWYGGEDDLPRMERDSLGWDHPRMGALMSRHWRFSKRLTSAIATHHAGLPVAEEPLPAVSTVAQLSETQVAVGVRRVCEAARERHDLPLDEGRELVKVCFEHARAVASMFE